MQQKVTWYNIRHTGWQNAQGDILNKEISSLTDLESFVIESVYILLPSSMADLVPCKRPIQFSLLSPSIFRIQFSSYLPVLHPYNSTLMEI